MKEQIEVRVEIMSTPDNPTRYNEDRWELATFETYEQFSNEGFSRIYVIAKMENGKLRRFEISDVMFTGRPEGLAMFEDGI